MKYIKLFENFTLDKKIILLNSYRVLLHSDSDIEIIYNGVDKEEAYYTYNNLTITDFCEHNASVSLEYIEKYYNFLLDYDELTEYPIMYNYDDKSVYQYQSESEYVDILTKNIPTYYEVDQQEKAEAYDNIKNGIVKYIKHISEDYKYAAFLNSTIYSLIKYKDGYILVRIADHFFNYRNVKIGKNVEWQNYDLSNIKNEYKDIYGFLSINILQSNSDYYKDKKGFIRDFKYEMEYYKHQNLIKYISIHPSDDDTDIENIKYDITRELNIIKHEIDVCLSSGEYDKKDSNGDYIPVFDM